MALQSCVLVIVIMSLPGSVTQERVVRSKALCSKHTTDHQLFPLFFVGMLMFFTVFVKGIPIITLINEKIGGDKFDPSGDAIVVEGTLFVIRSCVKFLVMNVGCALSDHLGRKPITLFFILPNLCMDLMLLFADINRSVIFTIGVLWGFTAITIPTLRAWVSDLCSDDSIEMVNAQGSFRGLTIGPATLLGIPIGTAFALYSNPKYAFLFSLAANLLALVIISRTTLDDTKGIVKRRQRQQQGQGQGQHVVRIQLTKQNLDDQESSADDRSPLHDSASAPPSAAASVTSVSVDSGSPPLTLRSFPSEGMSQFCLTHAPWSGYEAILELFSADPSAGYLWLIYFLTFCANEVTSISLILLIPLPQHPLPDLHPHALQLPHGGRRNVSIAGCFGLCLGGDKLQRLHRAHAPHHWQRPWEPDRDDHLCRYVLLSPPSLASPPPHCSADLCWSHSPPFTAPSP
jgi:hypothetical protein